MSNLKNRSKLFVKRNGSTILTAIGGVGVITTSVMAVKATPKALYLIEEAKKEKGEELTKTEKFKSAAHVYIPSIIVGTATIICIFGANILNKRQQASLMSAYALLDSSYKGYREKAKELYGEDANEKIKEELAKDKYKDAEVLNEDGTLLFYDEFSKRYFKSTKQKVQHAQYQINRDLSMRDWATLNEFYEYLELPKIDSGDDLGWSTGMNFDYYWQSWIDFSNSKIIMDDGTECHVITMLSEPNPGWTEY